MVYVFLVVLAATERLLNLSETRCFCAVHAYNLVLHVSYDYVCVSVYAVFSAVYALMNMQTTALI